MKTTFYLIIAMMVFFSCQKEKDNYTMDTAIDFSFIDDSGHDLLDNSSENHYDINFIKLYYLVDGVSTEVNAPNLDYPKGFFKSNELRNGRYFMRLFPNQSNDQNSTAFETITYLQLKSADIDTIKCEFSKSTNSLICEKVIYNGSTVWQWGTDRYIVIEK